MNSSRFAVTGAQGSGKSTLAHGIADLFDKTGRVQCRLLEGIGQKIGQEGYPLGELATEETFLAFAAEHLARERSVTAPLIIQDRCFLDLLAYARVLRNIRAVSLRLIEECTRFSLQRMDGVFLAPLFGMTEERSEAMEFRNKIENEIWQVSEDMGVMLKKIEGTSEERILSAYEFICSTKTFF